MRSLPAEAPASISRPGRRTLPPARAATAAVECWVGAHFSRFQAALEREVGDARVFDSIDKPADRQAVLALATLLAYLDDLSAGDEALAVLAGRSLDASERQRLAEQVATAQSAAAPAHDGPAHEERIDELTAVYRWYATGPRPLPDTDMRIPL